MVSKKTMLIKCGIHFGSSWIIPILREKTIKYNFFHHYKKAFVIFEDLKKKVRKSKKHFTLGQVVIGFMGSRIVNFLLSGKQEVQMKKLKRCFLLFTNNRQIKIAALQIGFYLEKNAFYQRQMSSGPTSQKKKLKQDFKATKD